MADFTPFFVDTTPMNSTRNTMDSLVVNEEASSSLQMIRLTLNLSKGLVRHEKLEGLDYLVAPVVMLTEGVHAGSKGPLFYPAEELGKTPAVWNHKPIVVYHPAKKGEAVSACIPDILNTRKVGLLLNTVFEDGKLKSEAWLRADRLRAVDRRVLDALEQDKPMEVSTGLFTDNVAAEGEWGGKKYSYIAKNYRPDHLAILPDQKGACSLADGAGLLRNMADAQEVTPEQRAFIEDILSFVSNELSHSDLWQALNEALSQQEKPGSGSSPTSPGLLAYVLDVFDTFCIISRGGRLFKQDYTVTNDKVKFTGLPVEVVRSRQYKTLDGQVLNQSDGDKTMEKKQIVDKLISNEATPWEESDRETLMGLDEGKLEKLMPTEKPVDNAGPACPQGLTADEQKQWDKMNAADRQKFVDTRKPATNGEEAPKPMTPEEYIAKAPEGMRDMLTNGLQAHNDMKAKLIITITANKANKFTEEQLKGKGLDELRSIAALATASSPAPVANYGGMAEPAEPQGGGDQEPLTAPTLNFSKK